jgi:hypothetical protein
VKTLKDSRAGLVDFRARRTTIAALRRLHPPPLHGRLSVKEGVDPAEIAQQLAER